MCIVWRRRVVSFMELLVILGFTIISSTVVIGTETSLTSPSASSSSSLLHRQEQNQTEIDDGNSRRHLVAAVDARRQRWLRSLFNDMDHDDELLLLEEERKDAIRIEILENLFDCSFDEEEDDADACPGRLILGVSVDHVERITNKVYGIKYRSSPDLTQEQAQITSKSLDGRRLKCDSDTNTATVKVKDGGGEEPIVFNCSHIDLEAVITGPDMGSGPYEFIRPFNNNDENFIPTETQDVWGWIDPETQKEYAIATLWDGTSFVDITKPSDPRVMGFLPGEGVIPTSALGGFHDVKVVGHVAYIGSEYESGLQSFDLRRLRSLKGVKPGKEPAPVLTADHLNTEVGSTHNIVAVENDNKVMAVGMDLSSDECPSGSLAIFDIEGEEKAVHPVFVECFYLVPGDFVPTGVNYVHDAQCVKYRGPDERYQDANVCILYTQQEVTVFNFDTRTVLGTFTYPTFRFVHQGWFSEDHRFLYVTDEFDELTRRVERQTTYIFDLLNLEVTVKTQPVRTEYFSPPEAVHPFVDHNLLIRGNFVYQASYTAGARIRQFTTTTVEQVQQDGTITMMDMAGLTEVAYFDLETFCDSLDNSCAALSGSWTFYPYFDSGITISSSLLGGLWILRPNLQELEGQNQKECAWFLFFLCWLSIFF